MTDKETQSQKIKKIWLNKKSEVFDKNLRFWHKSKEFETWKSQFDYAMELGELYKIEIFNLYETRDNF